MPHASKPVRYNVAIAPSIHQLQFPWVHTQQILRFFALCVQNFNLGFPQMIRYWGPPMYSKKVLPATKRATVSNNMPAKKNVCFCMTYIYIYKCNVLLPKLGLSLKIYYMLFFISEEWAPTTTPVKIQLPPASWGQKHCFLHAVLVPGRNIPSPVWKKRRDSLSEKETFFLAPSTHPHPALISRVCISK